MTRIDFYVLKSGPAGAAQMTACKLAEKAYQLGHRIYIHTGDADDARAVDELLWTFRAGSFIPHRLCETDEDFAPVLIGHGEPPEIRPDLLINLAGESTPPMFFSRFERVAEIVEPEEPQRGRARERFRFYRERGYELATHDIKG